MRDLNYFPLDVESNIYGMTTLSFDDRTSKLLVATVDCKIFCITYDKFKSHTREVEFTYIPNGAKINSIGALKRGSNDFVIGITHSLAPSQKSSTRVGFSLSNREAGCDFNRMTTYYFNIYASGSMTSKFDLDYVAQGCQTIRLRYIPYHLYQTELISFSDANDIRRKPFWLLSGGDNSIHAFCEDRPYQSFNEVSIADCFPELIKLPSIALWIDIMNIEHNPTNFSRAIVLGFEDGTVKLYHSSLSTRNKGGFQVVQESSFDEYTTIIPSVSLFRVKSITSQSRLRDKLRDTGLLQNTTKDDRLEQLNVLVISSTNASLVFEDVLNNGLDLKHELAESERPDCVVTSSVGDINSDGLNELIMGTHGRELLTYRYDPIKESYHLARTIKLNYPVYAISISDLTGDASNDLMILLASGVLVMQTDVKEMLDICKRRVESLLSILG